MRNNNPVTGIAGNCIATGRGAIAIRLALEGIEQKDHKDRQVLLPANICYAAVLPVIYAGYRPCFCDVDRRTGNVTFDIIRQVSYENIIAAVIPHMYGNPVSGMREIVDFLHSRNVVVIEDCASLMSRDGEDYVPGTLGDYVVYSTGYSKTIDIGFGGLLFSREQDLSKAEELEHSLPSWSEDFELEWGEFSRIYRILRNDGQKTKMSAAIYSNMPEILRESYNFSIPSEKKEQILGAVDDLDRTVSERRRQYRLYQDLLARFSAEIYDFEPKAVPWRFNLLLDNRKEFVQYCLENHLPVSDWYPRVTTIFEPGEDYPGAKWHEEHIVNFPLMTSDDEIIHICEIINSFKSFQ